MATPAPASVPRPTYWLTRTVLVRGLGAVYLVALLALIGQILPLVGPTGLTPAQLYLERLVAHHGSTGAAFLRVPTLFLVTGAGSSVLLGVVVLGALLAGLVVIGRANVPIMVVLWAIYLSLVNIGQRWFAFGWESQLVETGFLGIFLVPIWRPAELDARAPVSLAVILLHRWLIVRIMLGAGLIKLRGDPCWRDLTCLEHHFETQPIPNPVSWYLHHAPSWLLAAGVLWNHFVELVVPFFAFAPRRLRHAAGVCLVAFQLNLIVSGNLSFLNHLTLLPALALFDDTWWARFAPQRVRARLVDLGTVPPGRARRLVSAALVVAVAALSLPVVANLLADDQVMNTSFIPLRLVNTYGAFGTVTTERLEVIVEGTLDGVTWREYPFKAKPGDVERRPPLISPWHYRLDWCMWFAGLESAVSPTPRREAWLYHLVYKLLTGDEGTLSLLEANPFPDGPPKLVHVLVYRYRFTAPGEGRAWWVRERVRVLVPAMRADDLELQDFLVRSGWLPAPR